MVATWFLYTPEDWAVRKFSSQEDLEAKASGILQDVYLDGDSGWSDEVYCAVAGFGDLPDTIRDYCGWDERLVSMRKYEVTQEIIDKKENYSGIEEDEWP